ncbi:hypothetical protein PHAVU_005G068600 [Phaseolus vulgaris]|uniref:NADH:ubiquinone oxidoreductase 30kDa subunit domain-containing protein n=1 Tax=Phaseolus vulgaris TaxID=3885 RepID=V7BXV9_PHAVU|nr:hypothetical protein PHAVU_005G068600g [Phaseolus vulgaris]ESW21411.1 hypothetical protein PHAVU_005G068600g [Phaseolus vulgaris]
MEIITVNVKYCINQTEEVCIKIFVSRKNPRIPLNFWHPHLRRILMPKNWIGWPLCTDYITQSFYEIQDAH